MSDLASQAISALLGGGFATSAWLAVRAWNDVRKGRLSNSSTVLERLDAENRRLVADNDKLCAAAEREEHAHTKTRRSLYREQERAERFRLQLIAAEIVPLEHPREDRHDE